MILWEYYKHNKACKGELMSALKLIDSDQLNKRQRLPTFAMVAELMHGDMNAGYMDGIEDAKQALKKIMEGKA